MHHALDISEILYTIFGHLAPDPDRAWACEQLPGTRALAKLARTCRAFKEPALDMLWSELPDLSALARCVPEAVHTKRRRHYAFSRPLTDTEWATVESYARRVWVFHDCTLREACLEDESIAMLVSHWHNNASGALFPGLRCLSWGCDRPCSLFHVAAQPLKILHLDLRCDDRDASRAVLDAVGSRCPLIERFRLHLSRQDVALNAVVSDQVLRWSHLRTLECSHVALSADAIMHLSRMSTLTRLSFVLDEQVPGQMLPPDTVLVFAHLTSCVITSATLLPVAQLLAHTRLTAIQALTVTFPGPASKQTMWAFMPSLQTACASGTLTHLSVLSQRAVLRRLITSSDACESDWGPITYADLAPCMSLVGLRTVELNFEQPIHLTNDDIVRLASAWPHLCDLLINNDTGWRPSSSKSEFVAATGVCTSTSPGVDTSAGAGGLTLPGLLRLLRACPALHTFCLLLDTATFACLPTDADADNAYLARSLGCVHLVESPSPADARTFRQIVDVLVAIGFVPRVWVAWQRGGGGACRSWRDVEMEVKAKARARVGMGKTKRKRAASVVHE